MEKKLLHDWLQIDSTRNRCYQGHMSGNTNHKTHLNVHEPLITYVAVYQICCLYCGKTIMTVVIIPYHVTLWFPAPSYYAFFHCAWGKKHEIKRLPCDANPWRLLHLTLETSVRMNSVLLLRPGWQCVFKQTIVKDSKAEQASPACPTGGAAMCKKSCVCWRLPLLHNMAES